MIDRSIIRTDLAVETHEIHAENGVDDGIKIKEYELNGIKITEAEIFKGQGEKKSGKRAGIYTTVDVGTIHSKTKNNMENTAVVISGLIKKLIPDKEGCVLVAGIGNEDIISDAIGPRTASGVIATRHIKKLDKRLYSSLGLSEVVVVQTGVMGTTGFESAEIISALVDMIKPKCVIAVDSLASRRLSRLATTVQISTGGISPGAGVANRRLELNDEVLGVPVVAVGVPTVVDALTLVCDVTKEEKYRDLYVGENNFYVAPKETDKIIKDAARLLSCSINMALHGLSSDEISELQQ